MSTTPTASKTFSRRLFVTYQELVEGSGKDLDGAVERFASANKGVDLEQQLTFSQWIDEVSTKGVRGNRVR